MEIDKTFIRKLVYASKQEVRDLAVSIGASDKSIYKWMDGISLPDAVHLFRLMKMANMIRDDNKN
jgi:hypothetical protein